MTCLKWFAAGCAAFIVAGHIAAAAEAVGATPQIIPAPSLVRQIESGDQVRLEVLGSPDMTTTITVADDGSIRVPLAGAVKVGGQSPTEAARSVEAALKAGEFFLDPHATITVVQSLSQRVSVLGEVVRPGRYLLESGATVLDLIALAGGITSKGSDVVYVVRPDAAGVMQRLPVDTRGAMGSGDAGSSPIQALQAGDSIVVPKGTFFIIGQVAKPGEYRIEGDMLLFQAIAQAGGVTPLGSASRVEIRRRNADDKYVDIKGKKDTRIEPGDVITVKERLF